MTTDGSDGDRGWSAAPTTSAVSSNEVVAPDDRRSPMRKPIGLLIAAAGGWFMLSKRKDFIGDGTDELAAPGPDDLTPLGALTPDQMVVTLPPDTDPASASDAISERLSHVRATGRGGTLHLPPGEWVIDRPIRLDGPGLRLAGAGMRATRLRMSVGVAEHLVEIDAPGTTVERLTLIGVGTDDPDAAGHGVRVGSSATDVLLRDLVIEEMPGYGIGLQPQNGPAGSRVAGLFDGICLRNIVIRGCGQDGIDVKNIDETIEACRGDDPAAVAADCNGRRSFFRNLTVSEVGLRPGQEGEKPAIDIRGIRSLQNVEMIALTGGAFGIRFRNDEAGPPNGLGGSGSTIENFVVLQTDAASPGVELSGTEGVEVHNGFVVDGDALETFA
jgi:hypothetical protein